MTTPALETDPMLTIEEVAADLRTTVNALKLRRRRHPESAPPFARIGRRLLIRQSAYLTWLGEQAKA